jgi:spore coat protein U-like protein
MKLSSKFMHSMVSGGIAMAALSIFSLPALAATATTTFNVTATVQATCLISANNLGFGTYTGTVINLTTTMSVTCTNSTPYNVGLNAGTAGGATVTTRAMSGPGGATLSYGLYQDSGHSTNWGNTVGTDTKSGTGNGSAQSLTVYGQLTAAQYPSPGSYSDTITATITY